MRLERKPGLGDPTFLVEISQNEARVLKTLIDSGGKAPIEDLAKKAGLADSAVARAVLVLSQNQLVNEKVDRKSTRLNSSHDQISYAVFCLKKKKKKLRIRLLI